MANTTVMRRPPYGGEFSPRSPLLFRNERAPSRISSAYVANPGVSSVGQLRESSRYRAVGQPGAHLPPLPYQNRRNSLPHFQRSPALRSLSMVARQPSAGSEEDQFPKRQVGVGGRGNRALLYPPEAPLPQRTYSASFSPQRRPLSNVIGGAGAEQTYFIPRPLPSDVGKLVVVLDLDETLVYAREGLVLERPGLKRLLSVLEGRCEVVVWTAGEKDYALEAIRAFDHRRCIKHCIYRHPKWWNPFSPSVKELRCLGRPMERTIIVDNTPECLKSNQQNAILVPDFRGPLGGMGQTDTTLFAVADVIEFLLQAPNFAVSRLQYCPSVQLRRVLCSDGAVIQTYTLVGSPPDERSFPVAMGSDRLRMRW